jgi:nucleoside-diphosphate-sugar epimerase
MRRRKPIVDKLEKLTGFRPTISLEEIIKRTGSISVA